MIVGAVARAGNTWKARMTSDAAAYWSNAKAEATTSHVPTARIVTTPRLDTEHATLVVPAPRAYVTSPPEEVVAVIATLDDPKETLEGCAKVIV